MELEDLKEHVLDHIIKGIPIISVVRFVRDKTGISLGGAHKFIQNVIDEAGGLDHA